MSFNFPLFAILFAACIPGALLTIPRLIAISRAIRPAQGPPLTPLTILANTLQALLVAAAAAASGTLFTPRTGLGAPVFQAVVSGQPAAPLLAEIWQPVLIYGTGGSLALIALYLLLFRPRLDRQTVHSVESQRRSLGLLGRIFYGGVVEEVIARWGFMGVFAWLGSWLPGALDGSRSASPELMWTAIVFSGLIFGMGHLPAAIAAGARPSEWFFAQNFVLILGESLLFGWLFWQFGLLAAMLAHALYHLLWYALDLFLTRESA